MTTLAFCAPAFHHVPPHVGTYGDEVADLAASVGLDLDPEQRLAIDAMYAHDERGRLVSKEFGCAAPRQQVKTHVAKAAALADLVLFDEPECLWTAQLKTTAASAFANGEGNGIADLFENYDHLRRLLDRNGISADSDEPSVTLRRPGVGLPRPALRFMARSARGGRGLSGRRITFDEALFLKPEMTQAMVPVLSAKSMTGAVQVRYLGSAGLRDSAVWREVRDRGRSGTERFLSWLEWTAPRRSCSDVACPHAAGTEGCALDDPELIAAANLALGRRMSLDWVLGTERSAMTPEAFMAERLCWWDDPPEGGSAISMEAWRANATPGSRIAGRPVLAVSVSPDRLTVSLAAAGDTPEGRRHVEVVQFGRNGQWFVPKVAEIAARQNAVVVVAPNHPAGSLIPGLEAAGVRVTPITSGQYVQACGWFNDAVLAGSVVYPPPQPELDSAVAVASTKASGDAYRWAGDGIAPLVAATQALWGHMAMAELEPGIF